MLRSVAVLDANVLATKYLRDLMLSLAYAGLYRPRWSGHLIEEMGRAIQQMAGAGWRPEHATRIDRVIEQMNRAFPDASVEGYEPLIETLTLPDADDRHVLAAAITGRADLVLTFNLTDFPIAALRPYRIGPIHPDAFVRGLFDAEPVAVMDALQAMVNRWHNPSMTLTTAVERYRTRWGPLPRSMLEVQERLDDEQVALIESDK